MSRLNGINLVDDKSIGKKCIFNAGGVNEYIGTLKAYDANAFDMYQADDGEWHSHCELQEQPLDVNERNHLVESNMDWNDEEFSTEHQPEGFQDDDTRLAGIHASVDIANILKLDHILIEPAYRTAGMYKTGNVPRKDSAKSLKGYRSITDTITISKETRDEIVKCLLTAKENLDLLSDELPISASAGVFKEEGDEINALLEKLK